MIASTYSCTMTGIDGCIVRVETDASPGTPTLTIIGLPDRALSESRERVRSALVNSGFAMPPGRLLVNLAPADLRKEGPGFDLAIALSLLATDGHLPMEALREFIVIGELALNGDLRRITAVLPMIIAAKHAGFSKVIVPDANAGEATLIDGVEVYRCATLSDAIAVVLGHGDKFRCRTMPQEPWRDPAAGDFADVRGQFIAKRALEIAAAGGHNVLLIGPPGCGKSMLARRLPSILPAMSEREALDVTKIYSVAGLLGATPRIMATRPFRAPHHTVSQVALAGGGSRPKPGEITLALHGVLYLDEVAEFTRSALEVLRQPLEDGTITIARAAGSVTFPATFSLIASMNPCPCGYRGSRGHDCRCNDTAVENYLARLSGPLMDRIDMHVTVASVAFDEFTASAAGESSETIRKRVQVARERQRRRFARSAWSVNAQIGAADVRRMCALDAPSLALLERAMERGTINARAFDRIGRVARTIADLAGTDAIAIDHVREALNYRALERGRLPPPVAAG